MRVRLVRSSLLLLAAAGGVSMLGSSVQGVAQIDSELRSHVRSVPVKHDCPREDDRPARGREV